MLLKTVFIRSVSAKLKMKKFVTVLILLFPKHKIQYKVKCEEIRSGKSHAAFATCCS